MTLSTETELVTELSKVRELYSQAFELEKIDDPVETPYISRYQARIIYTTAIDDLNRISKTLEASSPLQSPLRDLTALIHIRMGIIDYTTEETGPAIVLLAEAAAYLAPRMGIHSVPSPSTLRGHSDDRPPERLFSLADETEPTQLKPTDPAFSRLIVPTAEAFNQLGLIWVNMGQREVALALLTASEQLCSHHSPAVGAGDQIWDSHPLPLVSQAVAVSAPTHCVYFLAQIHGSEGGDPTLAAHYCALTLDKQRDMLEPAGVEEWIGNSLDLSRFHSSKGDFPSLRRLLGRCIALLEGPIGREGVTGDARRELEGRLNHACGIYYFGLLKTCVQRDEEDCDEEGRLMVSPQVWLESNIITATEEEEEDSDAEADDALLSAGVALPAAIPSPSAPLALPALEREQAYELFRRAHEHYATALECWPLDGYVTDHVQVALDVSACYGTLADFEEDHAIKGKLQRRRSGLLAPLLTVLSPEHYLLLLSGIALELAHAERGVFDARYARMSDAARDAAESFSVLVGDNPISEAERKSLVKCQVSGSQAVSCYRRYIALVEEQLKRKLEQSGGAVRGGAYALPEGVEDPAELLEDDLGQFMDSLFSMGRVLFRVPCVSVVERVAWMKQATHVFRRLQNLQLKQGPSPQVELTGQMLQLLQLKTDSMERLAKSLEK
eukprot:gnl/Dysnectes_brevis/3240_a4053_495.p1 GENE.gnl/Dysnectes_brevis/3240_a4053_495~~gnl/Dysnectes_brevis/3240_a4053_495.p1  ORF type:complete len:670 (+),score=225.08 gnl/Dysnectes_brevis/3240_a4053_495:27-2036(+)